MESASEHHSEDSRLDADLPEVSSTPCFVVLDSQKEHSQGRVGEEPATDARARRLKQLGELTKPKKLSFEMSYRAGTQSSGERTKTVDTKARSSQDMDVIPADEEEEEVTSTQEDLFEGGNQSHKPKETPTGGSKDVSGVTNSPPPNTKTTPPSRDPSHLNVSSSQDPQTSPAPRDASLIIATPSETLGSLHLSGVVLANETSTSGSSASINVVFPSPEAYGSAPLIIPSTPTRHDMSNEEPMELSDNDDVTLAVLPPPAPPQRKSTTTSDESEDVYRVPAWQQELNQIQKRKEETALSQDSWLDDNTGSKQQRSMSASIDSANPSSELSENVPKSSAELEESVSVQQQQPLMMLSTTDESLRQSAGSRPPSTSTVGGKPTNGVTHSAPLMVDKAKNLSGSSQNKQFSLPEGLPSNYEPPLVIENIEKLKEITTKAQTKGLRQTSAKTKLDTGVEPDVEVIGDDDDEAGDEKRDEEGEGIDVDPAEDWCLRLSPSQTQTQTQYSFIHKDHLTTGAMSQREVSQSVTNDAEEGLSKETAALKGDEVTSVSRQATPWHSTQAYDDEEEEDEDVCIVIPESEKQDDENKNKSTLKLSNIDDEHQEVKDVTRERSSAEGQGMEDSVFLEGDAQLHSNAKNRFDQLGDSDNPSPIAGFHLSVPKDGALLRPLSSMIPHPGKKGQWRTDGTPRHSTPIAEEAESSTDQRSVPTPDNDTPKTSSKSVSALVVSAVIEMDSAESSEIPAFNLRNPAERGELVKDVKESPSKRQKSIFSRVTEATHAAKSKPKSKKLAGLADKDPFSLTKPKIKPILGRKRNQQSVAQDQPSSSSLLAKEQGDVEQEATVKEHGDPQEAFGVVDDKDDEATIPLDYHVGDDESRVEERRMEESKMEGDKEWVHDEGKEENDEVILMRYEDTQKYGKGEGHDPESMMDIDADKEKVEGNKENEQKEEGKKMEVEERSPQEPQIITSQERRRDPYEFTESQSNKTPTPMKTWPRKNDAVSKEKLPTRNLEEVSAISLATEQPSTCTVTPKTKHIPKSSRQARGSKRKRPQDLETTEDEIEGTPGLNRTRTTPRKSSSTVRKAPRKRKMPEKQRTKARVPHTSLERVPPILSPSLTERGSLVPHTSSERLPPISSPSMTERVLSYQVPGATDRRPHTSPASLTLGQISDQSPPGRQPTPWKIVRYKKLFITQRVKEVIEYGEMVESTVLEQIITDEVIEKLEQEFTTPSPSSKTSSLTSGSLADVSSLGSRTSSSAAGSLQKSLSVHSTGIQKSISLSSISEVNSSLDKTISLPGSEKSSPNVSGHEHSASDRKLTSPGGVVPLQRMSSRGTGASPAGVQHRESTRISPRDNQHRSFTAGTEHQISSVTRGRSSPRGSSEVSPSALMLSGRKQAVKRTSSKSSSSSSAASFDTERKRVLDGKDPEFTKPTRTPSKRAIPRTPEPAEQISNQQLSKVQSTTPPPQMNLSEGWNMEVLPSSEESEGIPCAQPRTEHERISSDETAENSDTDAGKETAPVRETVAQTEDIPEQSTSNQEVSSSRPTRRKRRAKEKSSTSGTSNLDDTIIVPDDDLDVEQILMEPPPESRQLLSAGNASSTSELTADSAQPFLVPGVRVFTRWMDGFYYPGLIKSEEKNNKLKITFDDGDVRNVLAKDVIIKDWLSIGQSVMAESSSDGYNYPGIVTGYYRGSSPSKAGYFIERDNGQTQRYPRDKVILSKDQATLLLTSCPSSSTGISDISLENLVDGPRQRSHLRAPSGDGIVRTPSKVLGRTLKRAPSPAVTRSGGKRKAAEKGATDGDVSPRKKVKQLATKLLTKVAASPDLSKQGIGLRRSPRKQQPPPPPTSSSPARSLTSSLRGSTPSTPRTMEMLLGPLPSNKMLFKGMGFFLTQGEIKKRTKNPLDTSTSESENEDDNEVVPLKDYARKQIEAGGGVVLKDFEKSQRTQYKLFLIGNTYCRTKKYFLALAFNMPCISHLWIRDCSRKNKLQSHKAYLLPSGETLEGDIVEWKPNRCILSGLKIFVMSDHSEVERTWQTILMAAGCHLVARFPTINEMNRGGVPFDCNVVVTDPTCPRHILHRAQQLDIPVVSVEWVMQSLINGVRMPYESHYKFAWDYKEKVK